MKLFWLLELWSIATWFKVRINKCLCDVCPILFDVEQEDTSSLIAFNSASVYAIKEAPAKQEGLELNASKGVVGVGLIYSHHRILLEAKIA